MGCSAYVPIQYEPCANCGHHTGRRGHMGCSRWGHDYYCCSYACGERLARRLEHGMVHRSEITATERGGLDFSGHTYDRVRLQMLRQEIKWLRHLLKERGIDWKGDRE